MQVTNGFDGSATAEDGAAGGGYESEDGGGGETGDGLRTDPAVWLENRAVTVHFALGGTVPGARGRDGGKSGLVCEVRSCFYTAVP